MANKSLFTYFPPPEFMTMPALGVDVTEEYVRFLDFSNRGGRRTLRNFGEKKTPPGTIVNGEIVQPEALTALLKGIAKETGMTFVRVSLPEEKTYVFKTDLPHLPLEAIGSAIEFKIQENVPLSPAEALFDYSIVSTSPDRIDVSVTAVPQAVVSSYTDVFKAAGFMPLSFKVQSQTVARAIITNGDMSTALIIHAQEKKVGFYIASRGVVQFSSAIRTNVSQLQTDISPINEEVVKVLSYWKNYTAKNATATEGAVIEKILLCGNEAGVQAIEHELTSNASIPVQLASVWANAFDVGSYIPELPMAEALLYAPAIGLALGARKKYNV